MRLRVRQRSIPLWAGLALALTLAVSGCAGSDEGLFGEELFAKNCAVCHGLGGEGSVGRPPLNAGSESATLTDEQIKGVIAVGPGAMPSFTQLTDEQVDSLVTHLRQLQGTTDDGG